MGGIILFDIDGVIRDVTQSYRLAIQETVCHFSKWLPSLNAIDSLKAEGSWNNDWVASMELLRRYKQVSKESFLIPKENELIKVFSNFYFGDDPNGSSDNWKGFIRNENLLVEANFFEHLTKKGFKWGFFSGAERSSAKFVLESRLGLKNPPLIAMGDAPEKPNPDGLITLAKELAKEPLGKGLKQIAYLGDTVADVLTVKNAREKIPEQSFISLGIAPPHLHAKKEKEARNKYEKKLKEAGADIIINKIDDIVKSIELNIYN